ncbi:MAG: HAMP domain-containing histidine kinase [Acidobacteriota bacterium]|nr:HAMP domain-containing histidine kinase [Acidobacteriota bacterium]
MRARTSVFAKLLTIMLVMATSLLLLVTSFFAGILLPALNRPSGGVFRHYVSLLAATQPDRATAQGITDRFDIAIRYEGPDGTWATAELPAIHDIHTKRDALFGGRGFYLVPAPNGGTYLFQWTFHRKVVAAHDAMLVLLLVLMIAVVVTAHFVLKRLLRPLRTLGDGVSQLSEGQLDVVLPNTTRDEFGALTDAFNQMVGRVRDMIRARDQLLLDVSHELRSPLTRLRVALELLPDRDDTRHMKADLAEMELMIAELLELERLRDGRGIETSPQDVVVIVRDVMAAFPGVRLVSAPAEAIADVDGEKVRTVFRNLLENAVKYASPDSRPAEISITATSGSIVVRVSDDGTGIPAADLANLFEPFFRVSRSRTKAPAGYGLGLSICKRIVEAHGGTITASNHAGRGATFIVTIPAAADRA